LQPATTLLTAGCRRHQAIAQAAIATLRHLGPVGLLNQLQLALDLARVVVGRRCRSRSVRCPAKDLAALDRLLATPRLLAPTEQAWDSAPRTVAQRSL
jgi:hypothetical protein